MPWLFRLRRWLALQPTALLRQVDDAVSETLRDAVGENTRIKADNIRCYEARVQGMIDELFLRMGEGRAHNDS